MTAAFRSIRPALEEHAEYFSRYIDRVPDGDIVDILTRQMAETSEFLGAIPDSKADHRYAEGKWSIREVIGHMCDTERVFSYRALRFSRGDTTPVPGFDENAYMKYAPFSRCSLDDLISEFQQVRKSSLHLFRSMDAQAMERRGVANGASVSVRAIAYMAAGHEAHHVEGLRTRYLK